MILKKKVVCFIFARGGSKGIQNKNIKLLAGQPLITYSISLAKKSLLIDEVIVSTDDFSIAQIALNAGAEVPFYRPSYLASDTASEWDAWRHAIDWYKKNRGHFDCFISLPSTSPLRDEVDIDKCINSLINSHDTDIVITITKSARNPFFNMVTLDDKGFAKLILENNYQIVRRQDAPPTFDITTVAYAARPSFIMQANGIFEGIVKTVEIPPERSLDIDTLYDFEVAEALIKHRSKAQCTNERFEK